VNKLFVAVTFAASSAPRRIGWQLENRQDPSDVQEGKGRWCGKMISIETYMKVYEASVSENLQGE